ncbi:MAG: ATP-binding protein, partial [Desulfococcaceae bacterium]|nr:ATP-binding protein [Desulfococcaceae bacterium]
GSVVKILEPRAGEKGLRLTYRIRPDVHPYLTGDPIRLRQILLNFVNNAVKFTHEGGIDIRVSSEKDTKTHTTLRFSVTDTGIGVPDALKGRLFQSFSQADTSTSRRYGGTGLGLAISRQLAELMGGEAGCESGEGRGSTFWFTAVFRRARNADCLLPAEAAPQPAAISADIQPGTCRILLAEDNIPNQKVALFILKKYGFRVDIAGNGREAVDALRKRYYDLVLMDMQMPETDGITATRIIRGPDSDVLNPHIPIVAMTANATAEDRKKCSDAGMDAYLTKPLNPGEMLSVITKFLPLTDTPAPQEDSCLPEREKSGTGSDPAVSEIFDCRELTTRIGMDRSCVKHFLKDIPQYISDGLEKLKAAVHEKNAGNIRLYAHAIRGICANFSAKRMEEVAYRMEVIGKQGGTEAVHLYKELEQEYETFLSTLSDIFPDIFLPPETVCSGRKEKVLSEEAKAKLPELIRCLEKDMIPRWNEIKDGIFIHEVTAFAEKLKEMADEYQTSLLGDYSRQLSEAIDFFDFGRIDRLLSGFAEVVDKIKLMSLT